MRAVSKRFSIFHDVKPNIFLLLAPRFRGCFLCSMLNGMLITRIKVVAVASRPAGISHAEILHSWHHLKYARAYDTIKHTFASASHGNVHAIWSFRTIRSKKNKAWKRGCCFPANALSYNDERLCCLSKFDFLALSLIAHVPLNQTERRDKMYEVKFIANRANIPRREETMIPSSRRDISR